MRTATADGHHDLGHGAGFVVLRFEQALAPVAKASPPQGPASAPQLASAPQVVAAVREALPRRPGR